MDKLPCGFRTRGRIGLDKGYTYRKGHLSPKGYILPFLVRDVSWPGRGFHFSYACIAMLVNHMDRERILRGSEQA